MESIASLLSKKHRKSDAPPHEHAASVNAILDFMAGFPKEKQMTRGYWDKRVKGKSYGDVMAILKKAGELSPKYSRGGFITNRLKNPT